MELVRKAMAQRSSFAKRRGKVPQAQPSRGGAARADSSPPPDGHTAAAAPPPAEARKAGPRPPATGASGTASGTDGVPDGGSDRTDATAPQATGLEAHGEPPARSGYLHIGPDWRITFAHLEGGSPSDRPGSALVGQGLWDLYPDILGSPFERQYRATMEDRQPRTFDAVYAATGRHMENRLFPAGDGIAVFYEDITRQHRLEGQLARRNLQQHAVARLGQAALEGVEVAYLLDQAVHEVASGLDVEFAKIVEPAGDGSLVMRAGVGWRKGVVGQARMSSEGSSQAGYALRAHGPVIVDDLRRETRFAPPPLFLEHGIVSGISVLVGPRDNPIGVLGAHSRERRHFVQDDLNFLQAVANLLAAALARSRMEAEVRRHRDDLEGLVRERTRLLQDSNKELAAFSYTVSHDLRTPLRAIDGFSQILVRQYAADLPPAAQSLLAKVQANAQRMGHLIEAILSLSRLGRKDVIVTEVDLGLLANQSLTVLAAASPDRRVTAQVEPDLKAQGDPELLTVLMANLLGNAWKFSAGRARARIEVGRDRSAAEPTYFVRDNGAGFDMEHAGNLFQPFQRLHSATEFEGTGVGLATVHRIVQRHGGRVWAEAEPDKGATVWFTLPEPGQAGAPSADGAKGPPAGPAASARPKA